MTEPSGSERGAEDLDRLFDRLELLGDLDDLTLGGTGGLATGVEILGDSFTRGPDDVLDAFEPIRDLADGDDLFDDLF